MSDKIRVLLVVSEASPFVKVGGLADVAGSLPIALSQLGLDIKLVLPLYTSMDTVRWKLAATKHLFSVSVKGQTYEAKLWTRKADSGVDVYFVQNDRFFGRQRVYGEPDDLDRFLFFSKATVDLPKILGWQPDLVHCNDWHTAFVPALLKDVKNRPATVLTVHNLAYQGWFDSQWATQANLIDLIPSKEHPLHTLMWSSLSLGIYYADLVTTVSQTYAREILTPEYGERLDPLLVHKKDYLMGITNGIDYKEYDPATDPLISYHYNAASLQGKARNKAALQKRLGLPEVKSVPVVGNVGRLAEMKGVNIMLDAVESLLETHNFQFVLLGTGDKTLEAHAKELAQEYPDRIAVTIGFDNTLAHQIYAGCDIFIMPSRFEPCGLGQMIAMRYGTVPVVRRTGGLAETVIDVEQGGPGFVFDAFSAKDAAAALGRALNTCHDHTLWRTLVKKAMAQDFSWGRSAAWYEEAYRSALRICATR